MELREAFPSTELKNQESKSDLDFIDLKSESQSQRASMED